MGVYKNDIFQRIVVRINEIMYDMCLVFPRIQSMLSVIYLFVPPSNISFYKGAREYMTDLCVTGLES